jgi:two-component system, sporulation sensor kinase A
MLQNSKYKLWIASKFTEWKIVLYVLTSIIVSLAVLVLMFISVFNPMLEWIIVMQVMYQIIGGAYLYKSFKSGERTSEDKTTEMLEASEKLAIAGQLAAGIAHEIRNPLTSLKGFLQLIRSGYQGKQEHYDIMASELDRIEMIVSELLVLSKPHHGVALQKKDLLALLRQVVVLLESQAIMNNVQLITQFQVDSLAIECNENQIKQVFINIIKNAIEAMPSGGSIVIEATKQFEWIHIRIIDQGLGIPAETLSKLGEPFYSTKEEGTGLGLMVSFKIIRNHGGSIKVQSKLGEGTTFDIQLPVIG